MLSARFQTDVDGRPIQVIDLVNNGQPTSPSDFKQKWDSLPQSQQLEVFRRSIEDLYVQMRRPVKDGKPADVPFAYVIQTHYKQALYGCGIDLWDVSDARLVTEKIVKASKEDGLEGGIIDNPRNKAKSCPYLRLPEGDKEEGERLSEEAKKLLHKLYAQGIPDPAIFEDVNTKRTLAFWPWIVVVKKS